MIENVSRVIAVDWSGDQTLGHRKIWLCEVARGEVRALEKGRKRKEVAEHLTELAEADPGFIVGFDFAFSFPAAFLAKRGHTEVRTVWDEVAQLGESWLAECPFPFWGKPGTKKPQQGVPLLRRTDSAVGTETGRSPKSVFQIAGAGAVGVGSLRGMPMLRELSEVGFTIWPFDVPRLPPKLPLVVEVWPRVFMGKVNKSDSEARARFLTERYGKGGRPSLSADVLAKVEGSDDAFDALVTALEMDRHLEQLAALGRVDDPLRLLEGEIWRPGVVS